MRPGMRLSTRSYVVLESRSGATLMNRASHIPFADRRRACCCHFAASTAQEKRGRTFVDAIEQPVVGDPQLSPDGKQLLFTIDKADWKANRRVGHIYRINADGTGQVQLTFGERGESSPRWSPDGKSIAFTTRRDADTNNQIYLLSVEGGEARRLTTHPTAPGSLTWAPDGKSIYFVAADAKSADEKRTRSPARRCVFVRGEQFQAAPPLDDGSRGQDQAHHRRRLERQRLRAERRRQAHRDAAHARARCSSSAIAPKCG